MRPLHPIRWFRSIQTFQVLFGFPGEVISEEYSLEYGTDIMEMHVGAVEEGERALVVDDLIATGGTLGAAIRLLGIIFHASPYSEFSCIILQSTLMEESGLLILLIISYLVCSMAYDAEVV